MKARKEQGTRRVFQKPFISKGHTCPHHPNAAWNQRGGDLETKSKLTAIIALLFLVSAIAPAMAKSIGPQKATENPHFIVTRPGTVEHFLPSDVGVEWTSDTELGTIDFVHVVDASKAKIPDATPLTLPDIIGLMTNPEAALEFENTWAYFSHDTFVQLYIALGFSEEQATEIASRWPEGAYIRYVNVGSSWNS